jgi:Flp pilus assembly protein TadD
MLRKAAVASYDNVILLSRPFLVAGAGNLLSRESLLALREKAREPGCLFVWVDPRAMTVPSLGVLLRTFSECFADARLWIARSGLEGPLLCLETGGRASLSEGTASFLVGTLRNRKSLASFVVSTRDRPVLEASLPLSALTIEVPDPEVLRFLDSLLVEGQGARPPESYILEALALHAEEQDAPSTRFPTRLDWIRISRRSLDLLTVALELFPEHEGLLDLAVTMGETLRLKSGYETLLEVLPRWLEASPDSPGILELVGLVHHDLLDHDLAVPFLERAAQMRPDSKRIHHALGLSYSALSRYEEAMAVLSVAQALDVDDEIVARDLGLACYAAGAHEQALPLLEAAALGFPGDERIRAAIADMRGGGE